MGRCELCGEALPRGEEMFKFHGYSGPCPAPPLPTVSKNAACRNCGTADVLRQRIDRLETTLRGIVEHWREFGGMITFGDNRDDYGFDERVDAAEKLVASPRPNSAT